jgi:hypothetical protein
VIEIKELSVKLQSILNGLDSLSPSSRPDSTTFFDVRTPSEPYSDKTSGEDKKTYFPVMVTFGQGKYEPLPDVMFWNCSMSITFMYPVSATEAVRRYFDYLTEALNGKMASYGTVSGDCVCAMGTPSIGQLQYLEENQFQSFREETSKIFGVSKQVSRAWSTMTAEMYFSGAAKAGKTDGVIFGNQYKDELSFIYSGHTYTETLIPVSASGAKQSSTYEQQGLSSSNQTSLETNTAYARTFAAIVRANDFWKKLLELEKSGDLQGLPFTLSQIVTVDGAIWITSGIFDQDCVMGSLSISHDLGKPVSAVISLLIKSEVGSL